MKTVLGLGLVVLVVVCLAGGWAMAADKAKPVTGEITKVDGAKITVADKEYNVEGAKITVDGAEGKVADLKVGMKAKLTIDNDKVTAVAAKTASKK